LTKAEEYLESAEDNFDLERFTPAAGDAIHAGISAKDAIVTMLTGTTGKHKDHSLAAAELRRALGQRTTGGQGRTGASATCRREGRSGVRHGLDELDQVGAVAAPRPHVGRHRDRCNASWRLTTPFSSLPTTT